MLIVWFFVYKKLAQFAVRCALPPRRSESTVCATDNKPSCVLHLLGWFIGSRGFSSLERRPEFWVLQMQELGAWGGSPRARSARSETLGDLLQAEGNPNATTLRPTPHSHEGAEDTSVALEGQKRELRLFTVPPPQPGPWFQEVDP